jgi:ABC-type polysaccharide/polyol phosphate transport system ATPase subunit
MEAPVVIEARGLSKGFRIPEHRVDTLKERATHPFSRADYRELRALQDVSFDVRKGEFFGIVGQNGSGKSTLLKISRRSSSWASASTPSSPHTRTRSSTAS